MVPPRPDGDRAPQAPNGDTPAANKTTTVPPSTTAPAATKIGPHPGIIKSSNQYTPEDRVRRLLVDNGSDPAREDNNRLQGVQLLDGVRQQLQLPVRTFDTACVYFHRFRLGFRDAEYNYQDAALASLFVACKVEDTIKKSKEILAAAYNVKNPDKPVAPDDKVRRSQNSLSIPSLTPARSSSLLERSSSASSASSSRLSVSTSALATPRNFWSRSSGASSAAMTPPNLSSPPPTP